MAETESTDIAAAVKILKRGGIVAFPTETVYGLGADATSAAAVRKVFAAKGRPATNPLIVHVADESVAKRYAQHWPPEASRLAAAFWPGPLTLVLSKTPQIVLEVTAGLETVGLRVPNHPMTLQMLKEFNGPVAAPSANRSGGVSPTTADHVRTELGGRLDLILDGGLCRVGIESTVLDMSLSQPRILRLGGVSREQIEAVIGPVHHSAGHATPEIPAPSPGMHLVHYSPRTPLFRFEGHATAELTKWMTDHPGHKSIALVIGPPVVLPGVDQIPMPADAQGYARLLYAALHTADAGRYSSIWVQMPPSEPAWAAVLDRIARASILA